MRKIYFNVLFCLLAAILLFGCAGKQAPKAAAPFTPRSFDLGKYGPKVDAFVVLMDASSSLAHKYEGRKNFDILKEFVGRMNQTLPELGYQGALRTFGHHPAVSKQDTVLFFGLEKYSRAGFEKGLESVKLPGGNTPMAKAIAAAAKDLEAAKGHVAVIIVSDGREISSATKAAMAMKEKYGPRLCIYTGLVGNNRDGKALMDQLAEIGQCGFAVNVSDASSSDTMADFVRKVFLAEYKDSDGDGVLDPFDECPGTPRGVKVDKKGCPISAAMPSDTDGDGVYDDRDKCPRTPKGAEVDERGCWVIGGIRFDFDKYDVKEEFYPILNKAADTLENNPGLNVVIEGHTDNVGSAKYNQGLSEKRAQAVKEYFIKSGIESHRMKAVGYGLSRPIASNTTEEGRAKNRRVELTPVSK